jgi:hypothetical protein
MADETPDFLESMQAEAKLRFGRELTASEAGQKFLEHGLDARIQHLSKLRNDETTIHGAAKRLTFERALKDAHHAARKVGR